MTNTFLYHKLLNLRELQTDLKLISLIIIVE